MAEALTFYDVVDPKALKRDYPIGAAFETFAKAATPDSLRRLQEQRFQRQQQCLLAILVTCLAGL